MEQFKNIPKYVVEEITNKGLHLFGAAKVFMIRLKFDNDVGIIGYTKEFGGFLASLLVI